MGLRLGEFGASIWGLATKLHLGAPLTALLTTPLTPLTPFILRYGFIMMEGCSKDVFFHFFDVLGPVKFMLKEGDEVTFIFNEYGKRGTFVNKTQHLDREIGQI